MKKILFYLIFLTFSINCYSKNINSIAAIVGDEIISLSDVYDRINFSMSMMNIEKNQVNANKLLPKVLQQLIDEKLITNEARILKISVIEKEVEDHIKSIESQDSSQVNFKKWLQDNDISSTTAMNQIASQILWHKLVSVVLRPKISVSDNDVDRLINLSAPKYNEVIFKQILIPLHTIKNESEVDNKINNLNKIIANSENCNDIKSIANEIDNSLDVDHITLPINQINSDLQTIIKETPVNKFSKIIKSEDSIRIIMVCDKNISGYENHSREEVNYNLLNKKMQIEASHYMSNLRKKAYIEVFL